MKNILIIASGYSGKATANGVCVKSLVAELERNGANVFVVSYDTEIVKEETNDRIYSIYRPLVMKKKSTRIFKKGINFAKRIIMHTWTPEYDKEVVAKTVCEGVKICEQVDIDTVISFFFPLEAVVSANSLKKRCPNIKHIICELDSVADGIAGGMRKRNCHVLFSYKRFLSSLYRFADLIMVLNCHKDYWIESFIHFQAKMKFYDIPILTPSREPMRHLVVDKRKHINFIYAGILSASYRSPDKMLKTFIYIGDRLSWQLDLYSKGCDEVLSKVCDRRIHNNGYIGQVELDQKIVDADFLVSIGNTVSKSLPSKVIAYMSTGKPIIHFSLQENDICNEYLLKYPLALIISKNEKPEDAAKKIVNFARLNLGKHISFDYLCKTFPMNLPEYSAKLIYEQ